MPQALEILEGEKRRKVTICESYKRQLAGLDGRREALDEEVGRLRSDMAKLKPPSTLLQRQFDDLAARQSRLAEERGRLETDIEEHESEIALLDQQIHQLAVD